MKILEHEQNTQEWLEARKGKITGSKLGDIVVKRGTKRKIGFYELLADKLSIDSIEEEDARERGHRLEPEALEEFARITGKKVEKVGLCVSDFNPNIATSPDGVIKNGRKYTEQCEVKCLSTPKYLQAYFEKEIPSDYEFQKLQAFIVNEDLEKLYFIFYDPRVTAKPIFWIEVTRDEVAEDIITYRKYQEDVLKDVELLAEEFAF
jgi:putative phage-type endonuclease